MKYLIVKNPNILIDKMYFENVFSKRAAIYHLSLKAH